MESENDSTLADLFNQLSDKTTALLHHLRTNKMDREAICCLESELKELQERIQMKMKEEE